MHAPKGQPHAGTLCKDDPADSCKEVSDWLLLRRQQSVPKGQPQAGTFCKKGGGGRLLWHAWMGTDFRRGCCCVRCCFCVSSQHVPVAPSDAGGGANQMRPAPVHMASAPTRPSAPTPTLVPPHPYMYSHTHHTSLMCRVSPFPRSHSWPVRFAGRKAQEMFGVAGGWKKAVALTPAEVARALKDASAERAALAVTPERNPNAASRPMSLTLLLCRGA